MKAILLIIAILVIAAGLIIFLPKTIPATPPPPITKPRACTTDAKLCPNGSYVSRTGPNCEFAKCP